MLELITHAGEKIDVAKLPLSNGRSFLGHVLFNNARAAFCILKNRQDICQLIADRGKNERFLLYTAQGGMVDIAKWLVNEMKEDIDAKDSDGRMAIMQGKLGSSCGACRIKKKNLN